MRAFAAKGIIVKGAGTEFDPVVVGAFLAAYREEALELPPMVV